MQVRELLVRSAMVVAVCTFALNIGTPKAAAEEGQVTPVTSASMVNSYLGHVRANDERAARAALIIKLRSMRDDLRSYAVIARGAKMKDQQAASAKVLAVVKEQISTLAAKDPAAPKDSSDSSPLDPMLFELGSN